MSTGNLHEKTARVYGDHCLLTSNRNIMADINKIFNFLEHPEKGYGPLERCKTLVVSPISMRPTIVALINHEIKNAKAGKPAAITLKLNSLSDVDLIKKLNDAAIAGVTINMIVRGIFCASMDHKKLNAKPRAISIVDEYLEHARVMIHQPSGGAQGQSRDIEITAREIVKIRQELYEILAKHSGKSFEEIERDSDRDYWMKAAEAKEYGLIDEILTRTV